MTVTCHACQATDATKPRTSEHFHRHPRNPDGLQHHCKTCQRARCKAAYDRKYKAAISVRASEKQREAWIRNRRKKPANTPI